MIAVVISGTAAADKGLTANPGDSCSRFVTSEPVENNGYDGQREADRRGVARIVEVADRQSEVIERGQRVAVLGLK